MAGQGVALRRAPCSGLTERASSSPRTLGALARPCCSVPASRGRDATRSQCPGHFVVKRVDGQRGRGAVVCRAGEGSSDGTYPWNAADYVRVKLHLVQTAGDMGRADGNLVLTRVASPLDSGEAQDDRGLVLGVSGDTLISLALLLEDRRSARPLALDLMMKLIERGQLVSKRDWKVLRVAIVALKDAVYIGRLFFGDAQTGQVVFDCDCRPSDACWLAIRTGAAIHVNKSVWESAAVNIGDLKGLRPGSVQQLSAAYPDSAMMAESRRARQQQQVQSPFEMQFKEISESDAEYNPLTSVKASDHEIIKRLKREMAVALAEEDYANCRRIKEHPFMKTYVTIHQCKKEGRLVEAMELEDELLLRIESCDAMPPTGSMDSSTSNSGPKVT